MQPIIVESNKRQKAYADEEKLNFRPSPNFKHMKKYLKYKFEEANQNAIRMQEQEVQLNPNSKFTKKEATAIQPPLPPNPPPPDTTICRPILIPKKEIEDDNVHEGEDNQPVESRGQDKPEEIMCRNFIRGNCTRGASCIFAHKIIHSQLHKVYKFCNNYQNAGCFLPKCKYVHATVFEREKFLRTAILGAHTRAHLTDNHMQPLPPLLPPAETHAEVPLFSKPPPLLTSGVVPATVMSCPLQSAVEAKPDVFQPIALSTNSTLKRQWSDTDDFSSSPRDFEAGEPLPKKSKCCDNLEFRYQYNKNKIEKMRRNSEEMGKQNSQISKKLATLRAVLFIMFKPMFAARGINGINPMPMAVDKDKVI